MFTRRYLINVSTAVNNCGNEAALRDRDIVVYSTAYVAALSALLNKARQDRAGFNPTRPGRTQAVPKWYPSHDSEEVALQVSNKVDSLGILLFM